MNHRKTGSLVVMWCAYTGSQLCSRCSWHASGRGLVRHLDGRTSDPALTAQLRTYNSANHLDASKFPTLEFLSSRYIHEQMQPMLHLNQSQSQAQLCSTIKTLLQITTPVPKRYGDRKDYKKWKDETPKFIPRSSNMRNMIDRISTGR